MTNLHTLRYQNTLVPQSSRYGFLPIRAVADRIRLGDRPWDAINHVWSTVMSVAQLIQLILNLVHQTGLDPHTVSTLLA